MRAFEISKPNVYTGERVLKYIKSIHHDFQLPNLILQHRAWILTNVPVDQLKTPDEHHDDPYNRVPEVDWDHVNDIHVNDITKNPIVVDNNSWIIDGNHRAIAARERGVKTIPAFVPYK